MSNLNEPLAQQRDEIDRPITWEPSLAFLKFTIVALLVGSLAFLLVLRIFAPDQTLRTVGPVLISLVAVSGWYLLSRGKIQATIDFLAYGLWIVVTGVSIFTGGVRAPVVIVYPVIILIFGWLSGSRTALALTCLTVVAILGLAMGESGGLLPAPQPSLPALHGIIQAILAILSAVLIMRLARSYQNRLKELSGVGRDLARRTADLEVSRAELNRAQAVAKVGSWIYDIASDTMHLSAETCRIFGLPEGITGNHDAYLSRTYSQDRSAVESAWQAALKGAVFDYEHRIIVGETLRWVRQKAELDFDNNGAPLRSIGTTQDITERRQAEEALRESETRFRQMFERNDAAMLLIEPESGAIRDANLAASNFYGYSVEHLQTMFIDQLNTLTPAEIAVERARASKHERNSFVFSHRLANGDLRAVEVHSSPIDVGGRVLLFSIIHDITEQQRAEAKTRAAQIQLNATLGAIPDLLFELDRDGRYHDCHSTQNELLAAPAEELLGKLVSDIMPPDAAATVMSALRETEDKGRSAGKQFALPLPHGKTWFELSAARKQTEAGQEMRFIVLSRDISERRRIEQERESYWRFFQLSTDPMCIADPFGCFIQVNPAFIKLTGFSEDELIAKPFLEFILAEDRERTSEEMKLQVALRPSLHFDNRYLRKDGTELYLSWTAYYDKNDGITYATARDITDITRAEAAVREARDLVDEAQKLAQLGGWKYDCATRRITWTDEVYHIHGVGKDFDPSNPENNIDFYSPEDTRKITEALYQAANDGIPYDLELRLIRRNGDRLWVRTTGVPRREGGRVVSVSGYIADISERKIADQELHIAATAFESQEGMIVTDANNVILRVNRAFTDITGYSAEEAVGRKTSLLKSGRHDVAFYAEMWKSLHQLGSWQGETWNRRKDGSVYPEWLTITAVKGGDGEITHYVATLTDISLRKAAEDEIKHLAFYDPLTRLPNRRLLLDRLQQALASSTRSGREVALLFIDLDNFKTLNDTLGHDVGDLLLQQVAQRLTTCIREGDTVARLGGDEFVLMLEDLSESPEEAATQAEAVGEKILVALNQTYQLNGCEHHSTPSIGVTLFADHGDTVEELLKRADLAMYQAKAAGRNTLRFFDPEMQAAVTARAALEADLRQGLLQNEFILYYQPQVDEQGRMTGAEALVRWQHPRRGLMSPSEFIPLAEDTGLILPLGQWVLESACRQLVVWAAHPGMAHLTLAVNVSARQFYNANFVSQVLEVVEKTAADPHKLKLELTESLLLDDVEDIIAKMAALKAKGVSFSLDDFGTGYSSLSYLKRLPLDQLKIDQGFVRDILIDPNDAAIARTIVVLAQSMGLGVIAEGVETYEQRDFLAQLTCHAFQGYLFGRPVPIGEFDEFIKPGETFSLTA